MSKPLCVIQGPVFNRSGYGDLATDLAKSLVRYGKYDVKINPTRWGGCPSKTNVDELITDEDKQLATIRNARIIVDFLMKRNLEYEVAQ